MPAVPPPPASNLSAGVAVARRDRVSDWLFLLLRVYRSWDFPKGMVERDEDPFAAAVREVREESTIADLEFPLGRDFVDHNVAIWSAMLPVLESGEHCPTHLRARKPGAVRR